MQTKAQDTAEKGISPHARRSVLTVTPLYLAFAASGVGVALPGALLPAMLLRWHLSDEQAGRLFLMAWIGSSLGALLVRRSLRATLLCGTAAVALGAAGLSVCSAGAAYVCMALYGFGLGMTMTSISLIRQEQTQASGTEMVRLNFLWAVGAFACPSMTIRALATGNIRPILCGVALCFAALALWTAFQSRSTPRAAETKLANPWTLFRNVPVALLAMTSLITGIEASAGGWLATFAKRGGYGIAEAVAAPTCFWAGLLLSRLFWSIGGSQLSHDRTVRYSLLLMGCASVVLIASESGSWILLAAGCMGFGIGPVYPLLLAWALRFQRNGAIFFLAGVGSACLPWLTGLVSAQRHSLRIGLAVPAGATLLMILMSLLSPLKLWTQGDTPQDVQPSPPL